MGQYRTAIIGLGNIAWKLDERATNSALPQTHAGAYGEHPDTELVAACDPAGSARAEFAERHGVAVFDTPQEMLAEIRPDIVSICSPGSEHASHSSLCLETSVPMIWLEKPPAQSLQEMDDLIAAQNRGVSKILVGYQRRYSSGYTDLCDLCANGELGAPRAARLTYSRGLATNGSHVLDALYFALPDMVLPTLTWVAPHAGRENPSFGLLTQDGLPITVTGMDLPYHCIDLEITFEEGRASVLYGGMSMRKEKRVEHELFPGFFRLRQEPDADPGEKGLPASILESLKDLVSSHKEGRQPLSNLGTSRQTVCTIEMVQKALEKNA